MIVVVIVLGVVALGLLVGLVVVGRTSGARAARIVELEAQAVEAELAAAVASERADKESARAVEADGRAIAADKRADDAERRAADAEQRTEAAEEKVAQAIDRADQSEERALAATDAATAAEGERAAVAAQLAAALEIRLFDADGMWAFGRRRMQRLWHDRLRLLPDEESPLDGSSGDPQAAVQLMTEASREESGVVVDLTWSVTDELSPARAALLVLLAEELIAVARESDGGELDVATADDAIVVTLRADPMTGAATVEDLRRAVESFGWTLTADDTSVAVRVPLEPEPEPESEPEPERDPVARPDAAATGGR